MTSLSIERSAIPDDPNARLNAFVNFCNQTVAGAPDARRAMSAILGFIVEATNATGAAIALPEGDELVVASSTPNSTYKPAQRIESGAIAARVFAERKTYLANSTIDPRADATRSYARIGTTVVSPIKQGRRAYGVLLVKFPATYGIQSKEAHVVSEFAGVCGTVLGSAIYLDERIDARDTDAVSGLPNRRAYERDLSVQLDLQRRHGVPVSVVLMEAADCETAGVQRMGSALRQAIRSSDTAFRIAGGLFAVILKNCSEQHSRVAVRRIQSKVPQCIATALASPHAGESMRALRLRLDQALYAGSREGLEPAGSIWDKFRTKIA
jgi:GGDEF domain-containing protein